MAYDELLHLQKEIASYRLSIGMASVEKTTLLFTCIYLMFLMLIVVIVVVFEEVTLLSG